jgi:hypothetical protein
VGAGGGGVGGLAGGPAAPGTVPYGAIAGGVAGSGLGYAAGKNIADAIDEAVGLKDNGTLTDRLVTTGKDIATGATYEMGGQAAGNLVGRGVSKTVDTVKNIRSGKTALPFTKEAYNQKASDILTRTAGEDATEQTAKTLESQNLLNRVNADADFTMAQSSGNMEQAMLEQSLAAKNPALAAELAANDAKINQAAVNNLKNTLGASPDMPAGQSPQTTGNNLLDAVQKALTPVKKAEAKIWGAIPDYQLPTKPLDRTFSTILETPSTSQDVIRSLKAVWDSTPKTVKGLQMIEREINSAMKAGTDTDRHFLKQLKDAVRGTFDDFGKMVDEGDVALYEGQLVKPSEIQDEILKLQQTLEATKSAGLSLKDQNQDLFKYLASNGEVVMQNTGITDEQYAKSLLDRLEYLQTKKGIGLDYKPPVSATNQKLVDNIQTGIEQRMNMLDNLQPADDVGKAYQRAKEFSRRQHFDRFGKGEIKSLLKMGDDLNGTRIPSEQIPTRLFHPSAIDGLIKAIGLPKAQAQMMPHIVEILNANAVSNEGIMQIPRAMALLRNRETADVLNKLGLTNQVKQIIKDQIPQSIKAHLETLPKNELGDPIQTARQAAKMLRDFGPAIKQLYGNDSEVLNSMRDYHRVLEMLGRNKNVSYSKGSTTIEKLFADAPQGSLPRRIFDNLASTLVGAGTGAVLGGLPGAGVGAVAGASGKGVVNTVKTYNKEQVIKILEEAVTDPETASTLMKLARSQKTAPKEIDRILSRIAVSAVNDNQTQQQ